MVDREFAAAEASHGSRRIAPAPQSFRRIAPPVHGPRRTIAPHDWAVSTIDPVPHDWAVFTAESPWAGPDVVADVLPAAPPHSSPSQLATGRTLRYEWETYVGELLDRVAEVENVPAGSMVFAQAAAAATWAVTHSLATKPAVTVVDTAGGLVLTEVSYPDDNTAVITFAEPTAGAAYLRG